MDARTIKAYTLDATRPVAGGDTVIDHLVFTVYEGELHLAYCAGNPFNRAADQMFQAKIDVAEFYRTVAAITTALD